MVQQQQTKQQTTTTTTTTTTHQHPHPHPQHQPTTTSIHPQSSAKDNVILLHIGLSASSHAKSHDLNKSFGWWEKFIGHGPNYPIDLDWYFVICKNVLGSCYGSTGPSSINPETNEPMGPISQSSQSLTRISGCGRTGPSSIALQYAQRHSPEHQSSLSVQPANHSSAVMDSRTSLKPINDSNNVQNQSLSFKARRPLKDNRRSGKLLMEEDYPQEELLKILDRLLDWITDQTLLSQEDQKDEDPVK
ncbi:hypothetical protein PPACK8108_LOCUS10332 [Phakopsora pachyrhizi]|uniref:Uncharacterized protein n=1 Tax=Phakopsora pachyrhizi TaxID=170000 RepID=A0AAV0AYP2_PHAPC|nr:hypothetical protein PPACK8108_LOCUS10332 [Phakopsora pachyrhizi]